MKKLTKHQVTTFQNKIHDFYSNNKRDFAWRNNISPYSIVVSEIMLQQTQTSRVVGKFKEWTDEFPDFQILAKASTKQVLTCWQGLGYNRRALALRECAKKVIEEFDGDMPQDSHVLQSFKGIGSNTAGSICAFAFNKPAVFIETNIRTVFIHEFFKDQKDIHDKQLLPLIEATVYQQNPRDWYYALMDYGVHLKKDLNISNTASKHYAQQSKFLGSKRQVRGAVVRIMTKVSSLSYDELNKLVISELPDNKYSLYDIICDLQKDGFLSHHRGTITLC